MKTTKGETVRAEGTARGSLRRVLGEDEGLKTRERRILRYPVKWK